MTNNIVTVDQTRSPFDSIRRFDENGKEYWIARELMKLLGYTKWERFGAKETQINRTSVIKKAIAACRNAGSSPAEHFNHFPTWGNTPEDWVLTRYACYLIAQNGDPEKPEIAAAQSYFAIKTREAEVIIPQQNDRLLMMQLENENLRLANENMRIQQNILGLQNDMLCLHGAPVVLALAGKSDQVVELEKQVTVIVEPESGRQDKIMTAEQLKKFVAERTGQKLPSLKWFADKLRSAGRDDLLIPVTRHSTNEYPNPDHIDEAMQIVYGDRRQKLIGEK